MVLLDEILPWDDSDGPVDTEGGAGSGFGDGDGDGGGDGTAYGDGVSNGNGNGTGDGIGLDDGHGYGYGYGYDYNSAKGHAHKARLFVSHATPIEAYWVCGDENHPHMGQQLDPKTGDVHTWPYKVQMCKHGLHALWRLSAAKKYKKYQAGRVFRVRCSGWCKFADDKLVCSRRVVVDEVRPEAR